MKFPSFILASQSPRRRELLEMANIEFTAMVSDAEESFDPNLPLEQIPIQIARNKGIAIQKRLEEKQKYILAADTIVTIDGRVLGKPKDEKDALHMLSLLSGKTHQVITGVCILRPNTSELSFSETTHVTFRELTQEQMEFYITKYRPFDKAGAYGIQEWIGLVGVASIQGDYYNVVGLPVGRIIQELKHISIC